MLGDMEVLLAFEQGIIQAERPYDPTLGEDPIHYYDLKQMILSDTAQVVVAESEGQIVGSGYAVVKKARPYLDHKEYSYLGFMYTAPEFRGQGVNRKIIQVLQDWSLQKGLQEIRLTVYVDNIPAIKAYEKVGFKQHMIEMRLDQEEL